MMTKAKNKTVKTKPRELVGILVKLNDKTMKIRVERKYPHPIYAKIIKTHKTYLAGFEGKIEDFALGDEVLIQECKPVSARKTWKFIKVTKKAE